MPERELRVRGTAAARGPPDHTLGSRVLALHSDPEVAPNEWRLNGMLSSGSKIWDRTHACEARR
jgi:hypothetical protein